VTLLGCVTNQARARLATDSGSRDAPLVVAPRWLADFAADRDP
jgi:hypothetical protein